MRLHSQKCHQSSLVKYLCHESLAESLDPAFTGSFAASQSSCKLDYVMSSLTLSSVIHIQYFPDLSCLCFYFKRVFLMARLSQVYVDLLGLPLIVI